MKKDLCELIVVIDESGSMQRVTNDTIGGFNTFLDTHQNLPGTANLTLIKFDTTYNIVYNGVNVKDVKPLDNTTYTPGGMTALLDAVGRAIDEVGKRIDSLPKKQKPGKVILMIITDGEENSSKEYKLQQIKEKMKSKQDMDKWEIVFLGADQDAWQAANAMGSKGAVNYSVVNTKGTWSKMAYFSANSRSYSDKTSLDNFNLSDADVDKELQKIKTDNKNDK